MNIEEVKISHSPWRNQSILRHLDANELAYLEAASEIRHYNKGEIIFLQGKYIEGCYLLVSGVIKQFKTGIEGREYIIRLTNPFCLLGFRSILNDEPACHTSTVLVDSDVCYIPTECLQRLIKTNGNFALELLQIICRELEESHSLLTDIAQKSLRQLMAELLLMLKNKFGVDRNGNLNILLSREELANCVGTATESVIRLLSEFKAEGYIDVSAKKIAIINEKALERVAVL